MIDLNRIFIKNAVVHHFLIKVTTSRLVQNLVTLTRFLIFIQPLKYLFRFFFWLIKKVGLTARNYATYPKPQFNICLKLFVLESIKIQNKTNIWELEYEYFRGWVKYEEAFFITDLAIKNLVKKSWCNRRCHQFDKLVICPN